MITNTMSRAVLYTHDLEPITVLDLSPFLYQTLLTHGCAIIRVLMSVPLMAMCADDAIVDAVRTVRITAERIVHHGNENLMLFTQDDEQALLLKSAFLPGQQRAVHDANKHAYATGFGKGFLAAIQTYGD